MTASSREMLSISRRRVTLGLFFCGLAFKSSEILKWLSELDRNGGVDPSGFFPLFFLETASVLAPKLSRIFRILLRRGQFPLQWRRADITPIPKGSLSSLVSGYRPISITPCLSKIFERLISTRLSRFLERSGLLPEHQYAYRKGLGTCDALLDIVSAGQKELDGGRELALVQLDFSAAFDRVNHAGLLFKLRNVGVGGSVLAVLQCFLSCRTQCVKIDGVRSSVVEVVSGVPQGSVLGPLLFLVYTGDLPPLLENTLVGYADDSTLLASISSPLERPLIAASLNRDLALISRWCVEWGMLINCSKTFGMVISRSRTALPLFSDLVVGDSVVSMVDHLRILGVEVDSKLTFEGHVRSVAASASRRVGILRKAWRVFRDDSVVSRCFWSFVLPVLEYCSPVWMSAAAGHLELLDRVVRKVSAFSGGVVCDLWHRRRVAALSVFFRIRGALGHPVGRLFPGLFVAGRPTRRTLAIHPHTLVVSRCRTSQYSRSFIPSCVSLWNALDTSDFTGVGLGAFKSSINRTLRLRFS